MSVHTHPLDIAVFGAQGRMGSSVLAGLQQDSRFQVVAALARSDARTPALRAQVMVD